MKIKYESTHREMYLLINAIDSVAFVIYFRIITEIVITFSLPFSTVIAIKLQERDNVLKDNH